MSYLPVILIGAGYVALITTAGPVGLGLAAVHLVVLGIAARLNRPKASRDQLP